LAPCPDDFRIHWRQGYEHSFLPEYSKAVNVSRECVRVMFYVRACVHVCVRVRVCTCARVRLCVYVYVCVHACLCVCVRVRVRASATCSAVLLIQSHLASRLPRLFQAFPPYLLRRNKFLPLFYLVGARGRFTFVRNPVGRV